jgi:ATP-dependent DNA helicase RecQ
MPGPVLLIDDLVDSGWTLTETGRLLSRSGSGPVYPLVLAISTGRRT